MTAGHLNLIVCAWILLYAFALGGGYVFHRLHLSRVVGEITGGIVLGPSCLGYFFPSYYAGLFVAPAVGPFLEVLSWIGLVLLMFISGFEIQQDFKREDRRWVLVLTVFSTVIPAAAGLIWAVQHPMDLFLGEARHVPALMMVIAVAFAITSIPVISRIFMDMGMQKTRFAKVVLATATVHDIILWVVVAVAMGLVEAQGAVAGQVVQNVLATVLFFGGMLCVVPRILKAVNRYRFDMLGKTAVTGYILFICFLFSALAQWLSVNVIFGAFLAGVVLGQVRDPSVEAAKENIRRVAMGFFIPVYFAFTGLKIDFVHNFQPGLAVDLIAWAFVTAIAASWAGSRLLTHDPQRCLDFAMAMNARGGPGVVLATVAFQARIINQQLFVMFIALALISSLCAAWWFYRQLQSRSLEYFNQF